MSPRAKHILIGVGTGIGLLGLSALGFWWYKNRKDNAANSSASNDNPFQLTQEKAKEETSGSESASTEEPKKQPAKQQPQQEKTTFPLRKGDKGILVKHLQVSLLERYGADILPKYGADGDYGSELEAALKSKGYPTVLTEGVYKKILAGEPVTAADSARDQSSQGAAALDTKQAIDIAKNIWLNATLAKLPEMVATLKRMKNVSDYSKVNKLFSTLKTNGVHQTVVNAALSAFQFDETSHQMIVQEFERMGLKYDGQKWSLSGIERSQLITIYPTIIRDHKGIGLEVPEDTLLGEVIDSSGPVTTFRTLDDQILYVPTKHISHV